VFHVWENIFVMKDIRIRQTRIVTLSTISASLGEQVFGDYYKNISIYARG